MEGYEKLGYVALNVSDVTKSRDFYEKQVGLQRSGDLEDGTAFLRCSEDHHTIALYRGDKPGLKRAGFEMKSERALDQLASRLAGEGIAVHEVPAAERKGLSLGRAFRISEPSTGATYEFYASMRQWGGQPFKPTVARIQRLGHFVLKVADFDAACRFHTEVLDFRVSDMIDGTICFMRCHPSPYHHGVGLGRANDVLLHHVNFMVTEVDDIGRGISRFNKAQVPIVNGPGRHQAACSCTTSTPMESPSSTASAWRSFLSKARVNRASWSRSRRRSITGTVSSILGRRRWGPSNDLPRLLHRGALRPNRPLISFFMIVVLQFLRDLLVWPQQDPH